MAGWSKCQPIGDAWIAGFSSPLLKVPSSAYRSGFVFVFNPVHREADRLEIAGVIERPFPGWVSEDGPVPD